MNKKLDLVAVKTNSGKFFIAERASLTDNYYFYGSLQYCYVNGEKVTPAFLKNWFVTTEPKEIYRLEAQSDINRRFELIDKDMESKKIPLILTEEQVSPDDDGDWTGPYSSLFSLYKFASDKKEPIRVNVEFDIQVVCEVDDISDPSKFSYDFNKLNHPLINKILYPPILLHEKECFLTSKQTYDIVREYIKTNIDPKVAEITSDYDFCFTVKKKVKLAKPVVYTVDTNNSIFDKRKRKPKYVERTKTERQEVVFEMTHADRNCQEYPVISGFSAANHQELQEKIDSYCESLIDHINKPLVECPHCNGGGIV